MSAAVASPADALAVARRRAAQAMWRKRAANLVAGAVGVTIVVGVPPIWNYVKANDYVFGWALCSAIVGLSMNVLVGYAGQISLAHAVLFGTGGYAVGHLTHAAGLPWGVALPVSGILTAIVALLIGFPALRVRGLNLAILTLGFQFVMHRTVFRTKTIGGGAAGIEVEPPHIFGVDMAEPINFIWVIVAVMAVIWMLDRGLTTSRAGRAFFAIRQDEQVAASVGIPVARYKLLAFAISGFYAGIAGALFGTLSFEVASESFDYIYSIQFLVFAVLGGLGSRVGTSIGAMFPILFASLVTLPSAPAIGGLLLVLTLVRYPGGIAAQLREARHIAGECARFGPVYLLGFFGVVATSIGLAIGGPWTIDAALGAIGPNPNQEGGVLGWGLTSFPAIMLGIIVYAVSGQVLARRLLVHAHRRAAKRGRLPAETHEPADAPPPLPAFAIGEVLRTTARRPASKAPLLEVQDVTKIFGGVRALDGVSLEVREGELIGIMGPNGSGKTTLLNNISGFLTPNDGDIRFRGRSILRMPPHDRAALGLGRTFQNVGLVKQETVFDNFLIAQHMVARYGALEGIVRSGQVVREERRLKMRAHAAIELLGLGDIVGEKVASLPHGRAKLVELGCALVSGPELLLLDEPAAGVSPQEAEALGGSLKNIAADFGVTILMIEHHVPLMLSTCDYIYVLNFGRLLTHGEPADVARHPDVIAAYLGTVGKEAGLAVTGSH